MKKIIIIIILIISITGCTKKVSSQELLYNKYVKELNDVEEYTIDLDFDINITIDKINEKELIYRVYIDNPKTDMNQIEAIVIHDKKTEDVFPSSGIFENKLSLKVNREENDTKGIILGGYIDFDKSIEEFNGTFKVLIKYKSDKNMKAYYMQQFMTK